MKIAIYARVSSDSQDVDLSIGAQISVLKEFAVKSGYEVVRQFIDEAESGRTANRPAFQEMIAAARIKPPPFEVILVWKLNRFARSRIDSITYKKLLKDRGIKVISMNEPIDDTPSGHMLEGMLETVDQFHSENMGEDIKRGLRESARRGFFTGSRPPYGLHKVPTKDGEKTRYKLEPDTEDITAGKVIRMIFDLADKDQGCKEIAKALNHEGLRTSTGHRWGRTTVHKVLTNEAYCGTLVLGGRAGHPAAHSGTPPLRIENAWPAIIDKKMFQKIQANMDAKKPVNVHPRTVPSNYLLSGLLFCSCGHAMIGRSAKSHRFHYYQCNAGFKQGKEACSARALSKDKLEQAVLTEVRDKVLNDAWMEELVTLLNMELDSSHNLLTARMDTLDSELNNVRQRLTRLYDALETGKLSLDDLSPRIREQRSREADLSKMRLQIEAEMLATGPTHVDAKIIKEHARDLKEILAETDLGKSKAFLRSFIKRVTIDGTQAKIQYTLPIPPDEKSKESISVLPIETPSGEGGIRTPTHCCTGS